MIDPAADPSAGSVEPKPKSSQNDSPRMRKRRSRWKWFLTGFLLGCLLLVVVRWWRDEDAAPSAVPTPVVETRDDEVEMTAGPQNLEEVLTLARAGLENLQNNVRDYSARLVKQERVNGELKPSQEMLVKIQTRRVEDGQLVRPMRVYLRFTKPESVAGREVIWEEDRREGKLIAHEAGLKGLIPVPPLKPTGMVAMMGNRYPITEIGLTNLISKLIERGEQSLDDGNTTVASTRGHQVGDRECMLIRVIHAEPNGGEDDFSIAEIAIDSERNIPLRYTAFGWPSATEGADAESPLLESYTYLDVELNVGLTDSDFDPKNPEYDFP